jgi:hypothetical protein
VFFGNRDAAMSPPDGHFQITALVAPTISSTVTGQETPTFDYLELRQITETTTLDVEMEKKSLRRFAAPSY